jgi:hypothetical protein
MESEVLLLGPDVQCCDILRQVPSSLKRAQNRGIWQAGRQEGSSHLEVMMGVAAYI